MLMEVIFVPMHFWFSCLLMFCRGCVPDHLKMCKHVTDSLCLANVRFARTLIWSIEL